MCRHACQPGGGNRASNTTTTAAGQGGRATRRKDYIGKQQAKRTELNQQLTALVRKRTDFIEQEKARLTKEGKGDAFDLKVGETIKEQIKRNTATKP